MAKCIKNRWKKNQFILHFKYLHIKLIVITSNLHIINYFQLRVTASSRIKLQVLETHHYTKNIVNYRCACLKQEENGHKYR